MTELSPGRIGLGVRLLSPVQSLYRAERHWTKSLQSESCLSFPVTQLTLAVGLMSHS